MSSIGGVSSSSIALMQGMQGRQRPDPAQMAEQLFSRIDSAGQGYIQKSDLQESLSGTDGSTSSDDLFAALDSDSDGKVTKQEFTQGLQQIAEQFEQAFQGSRMEGAMPPPPPQGSDSGFTEDELKAQLSEIGSSDDKRASLISSVLENFSAADTNSDGKVSFEEAMSYQQKNSDSATANASGSEAAVTAGTDDLKLMQQVLRLMQAYGINGENSSSASTISVSA